MRSPRRPIAPSHLRPNVVTGCSRFGRNRRRRPALQAAPLEHADAPHLLALLRARQRSAELGAGPGLQPVTGHRRPACPALTYWSAGGGENVPRVTAKLPIASAGGKPSLKISKAKWDRIEKAYGDSLPKPLRRKINHVTRKYLYWAGFEKNAQSASETERRIETIGAAASKFRGEIFKCPQNIGKAADFYARQLVCKHLGFSFRQGRDGLQSLALKLDRDISRACDHASRDAKKACFREGETWGIWIRELTAALKAHQLPTQVRKDIDKNLTGKPSPFVAFVHELQACIPEKYRRSQPLSDEATANIVLSEAIVRARRRVTKGPGQPPQ